MSSGVQPRDDQLSRAGFRMIELSIEVIRTPAILNIAPFGLFKVFVNCMVNTKQFETEQQSGNNR